MAGQPIKGQADGIAYDDSRLSKEEAELAASINTLTANTITAESIARGTITTGSANSTLVVNNYDQEVAMADTDALEGVLQRIPEAVQESKSGYKTTEFWLTIAISALTVLDGIPMPEQYEALVVGALGLAYTLSRGLAKTGNPVVE